MLLPFTYFRNLPVIIGAHIEEYILVWVEFPLPWLGLIQNAHKLPVLVLHMIPYISTLIPTWMERNLFIISHIR
jgi:hypothetical protein